MKKEILDFIQKIKQSTYASDFSVARKTNDGAIIFYKKLKFLDKLVKLEKKL